MGEFLTDCVLKILYINLMVILMENTCLLDISHDVYLWKLVLLIGMCLATWGVTLGSGVLHTVYRGVT